MTDYRIVIKWTLDENSSLIDEGDECIVYEKNESRSHYAHQLDIPGTFDRLQKIGGCTPEEAWKQTSYAYQRLRQWHRDDWHYVGCIVTLEQYDEESEGWDEISDASVWGINNDCGDYRYEIEREQIREAFNAEGNTLSFMQDGDKWFVEGNPVEVIEHDDSWSMYPEWKMSDSDLLPPTGKVLELIAYGDDKLKYRCTECGEEFDADDITELEHCQNPGCTEYPHKYVVLYFQGDEESACVLAHPTGHTSEQWDSILTELDNSLVDSGPYVETTVNQKIVRVPVTTWYAYHTGCEVLAAVPTVAARYNWIPGTYHDAAPSIDWTLPVKLIPMK